MVSDPVRLISICGPSGAGKSTLAIALAAALGHDVASWIPTDYYQLPEPDGELAWDWPMLTRDLEAPIGTELRTPMFDFVAMRTQHPGDSRTYTRRAIMLTDAIVPAPNADIVFVLGVTDAARRRRLVARDRRWGTEVIARWDRLERAWSAVRVPPGSVRLNGSLPGDDLAAAALEAVRDTGITTGVAGLNG